MPVGIYTKLRRSLAILGLVVLFGENTMVESKAQSQPASAEVRVRDLYPLVTTPNLFEARDFYVRHFGFQVAFQSSWFVYLVGPADGDTRGATLAFMSPDHPSNPPGPEAFDGKGMIVTVEVGDAAAFFEKFKREGAAIHYSLTSEDWGQKRFMVRDPSGMLVDVVEQIAPKPGYWESDPGPAY
ncbi:MAG TPA: VOC family protein [Rhizobiaceae bacterium]|nr:VOC family protein [Rhizobiaceae bacterium]